MMREVLGELLERVVGFLLSLLVFIVGGAALAFALGFVVRVVLHLAELGATAAGDWLGQ